MIHHHLCLSLLSGPRSAHPVPVIEPSLPALSETLIRRYNGLTARCISARIPTIFMIAIAGAAQDKLASAILAMQQHQRSHARTPEDLDIAPDMRTGETFRTHALQASHFPADVLMRCLDERRDLSRPIRPL
jgi:hypothetical protein